nr:hypothetical protein [uncultured Mucilaginibacter sp.]
MKTSTNQIRFSLALLIGLFIYSSCQKEQSGVNSTDRKLAPAMNFTPAKTSAELMALRANKDANIIRTVQEFDNTVSLQNTPLAKLSSTQLATFRNSLVVRDGLGVVSLHYGVLKEALTYDDFAVVLGLFGLDVKQGYWGLSNDPAIQAKLSPPTQQTSSVSETNAVAVGKDYEGYYCSLQKTCTKAKDYICMSGC